MQSFLKKEIIFYFSQTESGRIWFSRVVNTRRARPCVTEASFYSLAQHFAVALFECHEADDFAPAKSLMNMCFTFYHEGNEKFISHVTLCLYTCFINFLYYKDIIKIIINVIIIM